MRTLQLYQYCCIFLTGLFLTGLTCVSEPAYATTLQDLYSAAYQHDAAYQQSTLLLNAQKENLPQKRAVLLPNIRFSAQASYSEADTQGPGGFGGGNSAPSSGTSQDWAIDFSQPLLDLVAWQTYQQARATHRQVSAQIQELEQSFLIRITESFLAVLRAEVDLALTSAEHQAQKKRLIQIQQRYQAGVLPLTDALEAQAAFDLADADLVGAKSRLNTTRNTLKTIVGALPQPLPQLHNDFPITPPTPTSPTYWLDSALQLNPTLLNLQSAEKAALAEKKIADRAYIPNVLLSSRYSETQGFQPGFDAPDQNITTVSLSTSIPLYLGGSIGSAKQETYLKLKAARTAIQLKKQQLSETIDTLYTNIETDIERVKAQQQAIQSATAALQATESSYEAGTREIVDVLLSEQQLYSAQSRYANARYDYLLNSLLLHQTAGTLSLDVILLLDQWFDT